MLHTLELRRSQAEEQRLGHVEFLALLLDDEIARRQSKMLAQRLHRARFEEAKTLEEFDFRFNHQIPAEQLFFKGRTYRPLRRPDGGGTAPPPEHRGEPPDEPPDTPSHRRRRHGG